MNHQKGFGMLNILFLIPILFAFAMVVIASHQMISHYTYIQRECRTQVLKAQQELGKNLKKLIELNPKAQALRTEEKALQVSLIAARALPPLAAAIQAKLNFNRLQQQILRGRQELLITTAKIQAQRHMANLLGKIKKVRYSSTDLKIYKSPLNAIAPDHNPVPLFKEAQAIHVQWKLPIEEFVPQVVLRIFKNTNYPKTIAGQCAATLIQKGDIWNPKLHLARYSLNAL